MEGGAGSDTYLLGRGYGEDRIRESDTSGSDWDVATFGPDIAIDKLWFRRDRDHLEVIVIGSEDEFVIEQWYRDENKRIDELRTSDGRVLLAGQVQNLMDAMAAFSPPASGQTTLPPNYQSSLGGVIAANWQ